MTPGRHPLVFGVLLLGATLCAAEPGPPGRRAGASHRRDMPAACQKMREDMKAMDARFDEAVKRMNEAQGAEKIEAVAAALNELAAERKAMREHMGSMPACGMHGPMAGCPMMGR